MMPAILDAEAKEQKESRRTILLQLLFVVLVAGIAFSLGSTPQFVQAVLSGGGVSLLNGVLLAWRMSRASKRTTHDARLQLRLLYFYAAERFVVVSALLGGFMLTLDLPTAGILAGFVAGQAGLLAARLVLIRIN
jgi:F0F1-type ATP synthase assembly protein I